MPSNQPAIPVQQSNPRKNVERVVPAIPLALSKSKSSKPKPKSETVAKDGGAAPAVHDAHTANTNGVNGQQHPLTIPNGHGLASANEESANGTSILDGSVVMPHTDSLGPRRSAALSLSFGSAPDLPLTHSPPLSDPSATNTPSPMSNASPTSTRKMNDSFEGRPMRDALPPAFVPSAEQHTPKSASSSQFNPPANSRPHAHPSHPSAGSIVYVSADSSTSSPAPVPSASSGVASPSRANFPHNQQQYFVPQGYPQQASDQRAQYAAYGPPGMSWQARPGHYPPTAPQPFHHQSHSQPQAYLPYRAGPQDAFIPPAAPQMNGHALASRTGSQTSFAAPERPRIHQNGQSSSHINLPTASMMLPHESRTAFQGRGPLPPQMVPSPPLPAPFQHPTDKMVHLADQAAINGLGEHIKSHFANDAFSDCLLTISDSTGEGEVTLNAHRVILARNPELLKLIERTQSTTAPPVYSVQLNSSYLRVASFVDALKYFYGGPVLQLEYQPPGSAGSENSPSNVDRMETALRYIASGWWLNENFIADRGVEVATGLIHWDTIGTALGFALHGGLSNIFNVEDGSDDRASVSSSDESLSRTAEPVMTPPTYDPWSPRLLHRILDFLTGFFPDNFYLDQAAPQFASCPRLPTQPTPKDRSRQRSDPRLSQIRFGEMSSEDHQRPAFATTTMSSVLLSLPFAILKCVLEHYELAHRLGRDTIASIMRQVVAEREARRIKALEAYTASLSSSSSTALADASSQLVQNLYLEEFVETSAHTRAGFRIARIKRDLDTPPSSGACSERNK